MSGDQDDMLRLKLRCFEEILERMDDGILASDENGRIILYNRAAEDIEGLSAQDILGKRLDEIYVSNQTEGSEHRRVLQSGKPVLNQYRTFALSDRMGRFINYSTYPVHHNGKVAAVCTISRNERKLQEALIEVIELRRRLAKHERQEDTRVKGDNGTAYTFSDIVGGSGVTAQVIREAQNMAMVDSHLLIVGETGTGKEVFAQSIHNYSRNSASPFVAINCSAIPENLLESILFGTQKGAFTGAVEAPGLFEDAGSGTLFLDELSAMPMAMQSKILRVLQERKANRVGASRLYPVTCRIISAVNEDPRFLMRSGLLRKDLYYRISALVLQLPPLRDRREDIPQLAAHFIERNNRRLFTAVSGIDEDLQRVLQRHLWPGNVRELEYVIENLMIRGNDKPMLTLGDMPPFMKADMDGRPAEAVEERMLLNQQVERLERHLIGEALRNAGTSIPKAAALLGISRQSLHCKLKRLGMRADVSK